MGAIPTVWDWLSGPAGGAGGGRDATNKGRLWAGASQLVRFPKSWPLAKNKQGCTACHHTLPRWAGGFACRLIPLDSACAFGILLSRIAVQRVPLQLWCRVALSSHLHSQRFFAIFRRSRIFCFFLISANLSARSSLLLVSLHVPNIMALQISKVALAAGRLTSAVIDIVLLVFLFTLTDSFNQPESIGVGEGAVRDTYQKLQGLGYSNSPLQVIIAGIADVYDLVTLFDWTEKVAETSMVAIGDAFGIILAVVGVALMGTQDYPPADAPWRQDWMAAFGLLILFM